VAPIARKCWQMSARRSSSATWTTGRGRHACPPIPETPRVDLLHEVFHGDPLQTARRAHRSVTLACRVILSVYPDLRIHCIKATRPRRSQGVVVEVASVPLVQACL
jgi:hypothetical protein